MADEVRLGERLPKLVGIWERRKWLAILGFAAVFATAATVTAVLPEIYQSAVSLAVVGRQVDLLRPPATDALDTRLQMISQEILSRPRLEALVDKLDLYPAIRKQLSAHALVERLRRDIEVKPSAVNRAGDTVAFTIKYQGRDATKVALVVNTLAEDYVEENTRRQERRATDTADFVRAQLTGVKAQLERQERSISDFKRQHLGELSAQMPWNLHELEGLTQRRLNIEKQIQILKDRQPTPNRPTLTGAEPVTASAPSSPEYMRLSKLQQDLDRLNQELDDLRNKFTDRHPDVIQKREEIAGCERKIAEAKRNIPASAPADPRLTKPQKEPVVPSPIPETFQTEPELAKLEADLKSLRSQEAEVKARIDNTPRRDAELEQLSRDYESTRELYHTLLKRYQEAQVAESLEQHQKGEQFQIVETAVPATTPLAPNRAGLFLMSLVLSTGLAVALVFLAEQLDTSFHTIDELRAATGSPVLVSIPWIVTAAEVRRSWRRIVLATAAAICGLALVVGMTYYLAAGNEQLFRILSRGRF